MNKEYICKKRKVTDAINEIDNFIDKMNMFNEKHNTNYTFDINLTEIDEDLNKWLIETKVNRNER